MGDAGWHPRRATATGRSPILSHLLIRREPTAVGAVPPQRRGGVRNGDREQSTSPFSLTPPTSTAIIGVRESTLSRQYARRRAGVVAPPHSEPDGWCESGRPG